MILVLLMKVTTTITYLLQIQYHVMELVVAWEFCYQFSNDTSATFYPGIWITHSRRGPGDDYELVHWNNITFDPRGTSCQVFNLTDTDQFKCSRRIIHRIVYKQYSTTIVTY